MLTMGAQPGGVHAASFFLNPFSLEIASIFCAALGRKVSEGNEKNDFSHRFFISFVNFGALLFKICCAIGQNL